MIHSRQFSRTTTKLFKSKKNHWADVENRTTNTDRAFEHFDDLYASVYTKKWASMRLGILCPQKYIAVPNPFFDVARVTEKLESLGAFNLRSLWERGKEKLHLHADIDRKVEAVRLAELELQLQSIASTKVAEELETLYQNAPAIEMPLSQGSERRVLGHLNEAAAEYVSPTKLKGLEDFELDSDYYAVYRQEPSSATSQQNTSIYKFTTTTDTPQISFPMLQPFIFEAGSAATFPAASTSGLARLRDWLCVNGASLAPILALDLGNSSNINLLDLCAGPGTKTLLALMTTCPRTITANDLEASRLSRVKRIVQEFTGNAEPSNLIYTKHSAINYPTIHKYERVLADVPCSSDRISATISDNSLFQPRRTKERLNLVKTQKSILLSAFRSLSKSSGSVCVYSTCTLSPIENDGALGAALRETEEQDLIIDLEGLWAALLPFQVMGLFNISRTKFGVLVEPSVDANCGPMFIARLLRRSPQPDPPR